MLTPEEKAERARESRRKWNKAHPEYSRQHYLERRKEHLEYDRQYYESHRDHRREYLRQYHKAHRVERHAYWQRRRARKATVGGNFNAADVAIMLRNQKGRCWWCKGRLEEYHVDHRIPLSRGGTNDPSNLVASCPNCNLKKGTKLPHEFSGRLL